MGKIYYLFGKSASGKDSLYKRIISDKELKLKPIVLYTTRPMRDGEEEGTTYFFIDEDRYQEFNKSERIVEHRSYNTIYGIWHYFMADDGQVDLCNENYFIIGTLESYLSVKKYYGSNNVIGLYLYVEDGERLIRSIERERKEVNPRYEEICRRFLADSSDFCMEKMSEAGEVKVFENTDLESCFINIKEEIVKTME